MADISQLEVNGTTYDICDATARDSLSNYVLKTGDTMTGDLLVDTSKVRTLSGEIERGNPGSSTIYGGGGGFQVCDKNNNQIGYIQPVQRSNGSESIQIGVSSYGGSSTDYTYIELGFYANGDKFYIVDNNEGFRNALDIRYQACTRKLGTGGDAYAFRIGNMLVISGAYFGCTVSSTFDWTDVAEFNMAKLGITSTVSLGSYADASGGGPSYQGTSANVGGRILSNKVQIQVGTAISSKLVRFLLVGFCS